MQECNGQKWQKSKYTFKLKLFNFSKKGGGINIFTLTSQKTAKQEQDY